MAARNDAIPQTTQNSYPEKLILERVFDTPRDLVWKVWTDPVHLARWWGPKGFTNPRCEWNPWPGGSIHIDMRAPDGVVYPMTGKFQEVVAPERLVFVSSALDDKGNSMFDVLNKIVLTEHHGKTMLRLEARVLSATAVAPQYLKGMEMGWSMSFDRLGELLTTIPIDHSGAVLAGDCEIVATRVFDAPRDLVWKMWTMPEHVAQWWGPRGFTTTIHEMDVRTGGTWRLTMHGPDGRDYRNHIIFQEVVKPERLVFEHTPETGSEPGSHQTTIIFTAQGDKTQINFRMLFKSAAARDYVVKTYGAVEGLNQTLSRFGEYGAQSANDRSCASAEEFSITRVFNAPRDLVFKAFTEADRLAQWWGPKGCTIQVHKLDLRPGGIFHYSMQMQNSPPMWGKFTYREIAPPERIVFVNAFSDENGGVMRNPWNAQWPLEILNSLTLTEQDGKTTLTLRGAPINATEEERKTFEANRKSMQQGFAGTFDQLDAYLSHA